ncbi:hypothetical protein ACFOYU_15130, partial [Microvirga sp. GCM10011540]|uniref:hypothetical protein n=1 Tax=Microvirga sp. GCM10011540 TaxID=3317338 RepID=UPI003611FD15
VDLPQLGDNLLGRVSLLAHSLSSSIRLESHTSGRTTFVEAGQREAAKRAATAGTPHMLESETNEQG